MYTLVSWAFHIRIYLLLERSLCNLCGGLLPDQGDLVLIGVCYSEIVIPADLPLTSTC